MIANPREIIARLSRAPRANVLILLFLSASFVPWKIHSDGGASPREPIKELAQDNERLQSNEDCRLQDNGKRDRSPNTQREAQISDDAFPKGCDVKTNNQRNQSQEAKIETTPAMTLGKMAARSMFTSTNGAESSIEWCDVHIYYTTSSARLSTLIFRSNFHRHLRAATPDLRRGRICEFKVTF